MERVHTGSDTGIKECISVKMHNEDDCLLFLRESTGHTGNYFSKSFSWLVYNIIPQTLNDVRNYVSGPFFYTAKYPFSMLENLILVLRPCGGRLYVVIMFTARIRQHKYTYNNTVT